MPLRCIKPPFVRLWLILFIVAISITASEVIKAQAPAEDRPLAQKASYSQARCAGLKRKKTVRTFGLGLSDFQMKVSIYKL